MLFLVSAYSSSSNRSRENFVMLCCAVKMKVYTDIC